jgi:aldehyde:ferredoxin oxidoreductase
LTLGYTGKFLEVDLSEGSFKHVTLAEGWLKDYVGGRALAARILCDRLLGEWEDLDPLGPGNLLLLLPGPLTGFYPGGRVCVSGKSPQSNGVVGSTVGGEFGVELRCAGYDGVIVTGRAEKPVYVFIKDADAEIRDASHIWRRDGKETNTLLTRECRRLLHERYPNYGEWKEPAKLYIGPAGENKVRTAVVVAKWTHAAGYGGYGAVMGSKNLKAVVAKGTGPLPEVADLGGVCRLIDVVNKSAYDNPLWRRWGTGGGGYLYGARTSSEPVRNWQEEWHDERGYGVDQFESRVWVKQAWSDFGCATNCLKIAMVKSGRFRGAIADNPDYELQAYLGPNLGIFTPEDDVFLASLICDLGLCGIQTGNVMGFAAELFQRGILSKKDLDGIELAWGDTDAFATLARKIALREGIGDLLAEGTYRAAVKIGRMKGRDVLQYAVQSKGIGIGAHGVRSGRDFSTDIGYACSVQGGDHTSLTDLAGDGAVREVWAVFNDSAVCCNFSGGFGLPSNLKFDFYRAVTGLALTRETWSTGGGLKALQIQRALLLLGGPDLKWDPKAHDDNPRRFYEPLPSGPCKGKAVDHTGVKESVSQYYREAGWDENGIPTSSTLKKLGLAAVDRALEKLRK